MSVSESIDKLTAEINDFKKRMDSWGEIFEAIIHAQDKTLANQLTLPYLASQTNNRKLKREEDLKEKGLEDLYPHERWVRSSDKAWAEIRNQKIRKIQEEEFAKTTRG